MLIERKVDVSTDSQFIEEVNAFLKKIKDTGYAYPFGSGECRYITSKEAIRELVKDAISILDTHKTTIPCE